MRRILIGLAAFVGVGLLCASYMVWPLATAWRIREAVRGGDSEYLAEKIEWQSVKRTLKPSMTRLAVGPAPGEDGSEPNPGLWKRFKSYLGRNAVDQMVETMVTPEGLPQLFEYGRTYRQKVQGDADEPSTLPTSERVRRFWSRIIRAEFTGLTRFVLEMRDRHEASRTFTGVLELKGAEWKLTELTVSQSGAAATARAEGASAVR